MKFRRPLFLILILLMAFIQSPLAVIPQVKADSGSWQVDFSSDDCIKYPPNSISLVYPGILWTHDSVENMESGMRWRSVTIPHGANIISAYITWNADYTRFKQVNPNVTLTGEDADNCLTFSTWQDFDDRNRTDATAIYEIPAIVENNWYNTTDLSAIIQEIVNRPGWSSGNSLAIFTGPKETTAQAVVGESFDHAQGATDAPILLVTWSIISPPSDPIDLFGAGFNASSPYVELHWNHSLVDVQFFEVQNSTDKVSWDYLGQNTTAEYTDFQVVNGTERYYRVRACNFTDGNWYNSSFTDINFETVYFVMPSGAGECAGWLSGWDNRVKITIDSGDIGAYLSNFPVLIYLSNSSGINGDNVTFVFDEVGANSLKIAVTLSDGITECYVEVEKWDLGNEEAWLWAKISAISNITDTEIYLYYDNDHADNGAYVGLTNSAVAENVWDSDFLMVQHQAGDSSPIRDSTSSDTDMTEGGDPTYLQVGPIDGEIDYDGNDYHLSAINVFDAIVGADKGTMSLWINTTTSVAASHVPLNIEGAYVMLFRIGEGGLLKTFWSGTHFDSARTTTQINTGAQFYIVSTYDGSNQRVYVNGNLEATDACNLYDITALNRATGLASNWDGSTSIDANIDEVRVSKINRSPSWIVASYETGRDDLLDFGSEEEAPATVVEAFRPEGWVLTIMISAIGGTLIILGTRRRRK